MPWKKRRDEKIIIRCHDRLRAVFLLALDVLDCKMMASAMLFFEKMKLIY